MVFDPRKNALLKNGSKSDGIDACKLAELLRGNQLHSVYHGEHGVRTLKELGRSYQTLTEDITRTQKYSRPPVEEELFFLTFLSIELIDGIASHPRI